MCCSATPEVMEREETLLLTRRFVRELRSTGAFLPEPSKDAILCAGLVGALPGWVARFGPLSDGKNIWLCCDPRVDPESAPSGQFLLKLPPGRYIIDTFDLSSHNCICRESAAAAPLVAGMAYTGHRILLWIRPC